MERSFSIKKEQELIEVNNLTQLNSGNNESWLLLPNFLGHGSMKEIRLKEGFTLFIEDLNSKETFISSLACDHFPVRFSFTVYGEVKIHDEINGFYHIQNRGESSFTFTTNPTKGSIEKKAGERTTLITLLIAPHLFAGMMEDDADQISVNLKSLIKMRDAFKYHWTIFQTAEIREVLNQILTCPYKGLTRRLFFESKAIELIALILDYLGNENRDVFCRKWNNSRDIKKLYQAKDILISRMEAPPGLFELAQEVGLSHTRLNRGFHGLFDTTVFGYLKRLRLETARSYLESGEMNVTEAAYSVGYSSLSHFSMVFKKYTGVNPGIYVRNERKRIISVR